MNQNSQSPKDEWPDRPRRADGGSPTEIERLLQNARPRPPQLNLAAIARRARHASEPVASAAETTHVGRSPGPSSGLRRRNHAYAAMAGSWICGAVAGALVMFLWQGPSAPMAGHGNPAPLVAGESTRVAPSTPEAPQPSGQPQLESVVGDPALPSSSEGNGPAISGLLGSAAREPARSERDHVALRVGTHLSGVAATLATTERAWDPELRNLAGLAADRDPPGPSKSPTTRERLLRELLDAESGQLF